MTLAVPTELGRPAPSVLVRQRPRAMRTELDRPTPFAAIEPGPRSPRVELGRSTILRVHQNPPLPAALRMAMAAAVRHHGTAALGDLSPSRVVSVARAAREPNYRTPSRRRIR
ncbi:MAG: hypothetical protein HOV79_15570 [Hamadaea sp.]|nr:hypothetical protein [Hamadaea sp.]